MENIPQKKEIKDLGSTLLDIAMILMVSGASTGRIRNTIDRVSNSFGYTANMLVSQRSIMLSIYDAKNDCVFNSLKRTNVHGVNFHAVSEISQMSWQVVEEKWEVSRINAELRRIMVIPHYPRAVVIALTAIAGASFCRLATGSAMDMAFVFLGTALGLFVRQEATKMKFNPYFCVYFAALTSSMITGSLVKFHPQSNHEFAFATSVLFLIPGIPLINAFSDMIEGNLQNGLIRGLNGFIISFSIALGLLTAMAIYQF